MCYGLSLIMQLKKGLDTKKFKIGVVGAGAWGTALADLLASKGYPIDLWVFEKEVKNQILEFRENRIFLPDVELSSNLHPTNDLAEVVSGKNLVVVVVPSHLMRETTLKMAAMFQKKRSLCRLPRELKTKRI